MNEMVFGMKVVESLEENSNIKLKDMRYAVEIAAS